MELPSDKEVVPRPIEAKLGNDNDLSGDSCVSLSTRAGRLTELFPSCHPI